jgi:hypothetical protein
MLTGMGEDWPRERLMEMIQEHALQNEWNKVLESAD